jgi:hypothetical protein
MKFVVSEWDGTVTRTNVANALTAVSPVESPATDYQRGYVDALIRVGLVFGVELTVAPPTVVKVEVQR